MTIRLLWNVYGRRGAQVDDISELDDIPGLPTDVVLNQADHRWYRYDGAAWVPLPVGAEALADLSDVTIGTPTDGDVLTFDSGFWIPEAPSSGGITQLTGDVTAGPGSGSQGATIPNDTVTYAKMQNVSAASRILGRGSASAGDVQELTPDGTTITISGTTISAVPGSGGSGNSTYTGAEGSEPSTNDGDLYFPNDGFYVRRRASGLWIPQGWGPIFPMTEPILSDFSSINTTGCTADDTKGGIYFEAPAGGGDNLFSYAKSQPSTPYHIIGAFIPHLQFEANYFGAGIYFRESGTNKVVSWSFGYGSRFRVVHWTNNTSYTGDALVLTPPTLGDLIRFRIGHDGTNLTFDTSPDGQHWIQRWTEAKNAFFTTAPNQVGFFVYVNNASLGAAMTLFDFKATA